MKPLKWQDTPTAEGWWVVKTARSLFEVPTRLLVVLDNLRRGLAVRNPNSLWLGPLPPLPDAEILEAIEEEEE